MKHRFNRCTLASFLLLTKSFRFKLFLFGEPLFHKCLNVSSFVKEDSSVILCYFFSKEKYSVVSLATLKAVVQIFSNRILYKSCFLIKGFLLMFDCFLNIQTKRRIRRTKNLPPFSSQPHTHVNKLSRH